MKGGLGPPLPAMVSVEWGMGGIDGGWGYKWAVWDTEVGNKDGVENLKEVADMDGMAVMDGSGGDIYRGGEGIAYF